MDITILVCTCDEYFNLWNNFTQLANKHLIFNCDRFFVTQTIDSPYAPYKTIKAGHIPWSDRLLYALNTINTKYVLLLLEDYFFIDTISQEEMHEYLEIMRQLNANKILLDDKCTFYKLHQIGNTNNNLGIYKFDANSDYLTSTQPAIWDIKFLTQSLKSNWKPWEFEVYGTNLLKGTDHMILRIERLKRAHWVAVRAGRIVPEWEQFRIYEQLDDMNL